MLNSKLFYIIQLLSTKERQIIMESLLSPLVEGKDHHLKLYIWITNSLSQGQQLSRASMRKQVFNNKISDAQLRLFMSELYKMISSVLVMLSSKSDFAYQDKILLKRFKHTEVQKLFDSQFKGSQKRLNNYPYRNSEYLEIKYELAFQEYAHISSSSRTIDLNLQELLDDVDHIFISKKLRQVCFAVAHQSVYGLKYNYGLLPSILSYIETNNLLEIPAIKLYYSAYKMLHLPKEAVYFNDFKADIDQFKHLFPDEELQGIYRFAINQCIRLINRGHIEFGNIALDLYKEALDNRYLLVDGYLSRFTYRNITAIAVKIGDFERAEHFTHNYQLFLRKEERNSALHFNQALIGYNKKDFHTALVSLQNVDFKDHLFNLAAKVIQMKIYFESEELDLLDSHLDAMQMYLLRKKVIGYHKTNYKNIIKFTRKLLKMNQNDEQSIQNLKNEIGSIETLTEKKWLLTQL